MRRNFRTGLSMLRGDSNVWTSSNYTTLAKEGMDIRRE